MKWPCLLIGRTHLPSGRVRTVDRLFDGAGDVKAKAMAELAKRRDKGAPWYGDAVTVITPLGQRVIVEIQWPGEQ